MDFCQSCGAMLTRMDEGSLLCACGSRQQPKKATLRERMPQPQAIDVVDRQINPLATHDHACKRCGFPKAEILTKGTIVTDEDEFFMWRCGKCGYSEKADGLKVT